MKGATIVLMKGYNGKSRLRLNKRFRLKLINALTNDLFETINETKNELWDSYIASPDKLLLKRCKNKKMPTIDLVPGDLNFIFKQIQDWSVENGYKAIILCAGDIPLLHSDLIDRIINQLEYGVLEKGKSMIVYPSKKDGVSIIAMSPPNLWRITERKGINNLNVIKKLDQEKYPYQIINDVSTYIDLDERDDLVSAFMLMEENPAYWYRSVRRVLNEFLIAGIIEIENVN